MVKGVPEGDGRATGVTGRQGEDRALAYLLQRGLRVVARNYRVARGPGAPGGEIDLIMREPDGTLAFVEVRQRAGAAHGGAAATVGPGKQRRIVRAAQHYLLSWPSLPPCRFDVVAIDGDELTWIRGAFDAG
jgi:putative endonuclease